MSFLLAKDTISGQSGRAYATINGLVEEMFYIKAFEAKAEKSKAEMKAIGRRGTQSKTTGWKGTGSMTIYYTTSRFRQLMLDYIANGRDTYFDIMITNEDPDSGTGRQTVIVRNVNLDSVILAKLDTESEMLDEEVAFTFDGAELPEAFTKPQLG